MTRQTEQNEALAVWANLSLEERLADRTRAAAFAAEQIRIMVEMDESPSHLVAKLAAAARSAEDELRQILHQLPLLPILAVAERDREVEKTLLTLDGCLHSQRVVADRSWAAAERIASQYGLAFYYEIRRLEQIVLYGRFG